MSERPRTFLGLALSVVVLAFALALAWKVLAHLPEELTRQEAERLLRSADFLRETAKTRLALYRNLLFPAADLIAEHHEVVKFIDLGLVEVRPNDVLWGKPVGARFVLTPEGERAAASGWQHTSAPGGQEAWLVPTARKELLAVRKPVTRKESADCVFLWKWVPTKVGGKSGAPAGTETYGARFVLAEGVWILDESSIVQLATK